MHRIPTFASLRAFEAAARLKSIRQAAIELCVDHASVGRHIASLQRDLGVPLVRTSPTGLDLTNEGRVYAQRIRAAFSELAHATAEAKLGRTRDSLEVWCIPGLAARWLTPRLSKFLDAHVGIRVTLRPTDGPPDLRAGQADIDIRLGREVGPGLRSIVIDNPRWFPVASPSHALNHSRLRSAQDLLGASLIHEDSYEHWRMWLSAAGVISEAALDGPRFWQAPLVLEAARRGSGVALANELLVEEDLRNGSLVELLATSITLIPYCLVARAERWDDPVIAEFRRWIVEQIGPSQIKA